MERIGVQELIQNPSRILARVCGGETVEITERGLPIARRVPVGGGKSALAKLVAAGRAVPPAGTGPALPLPLPSKLGDERIDVGAALSEMRDEKGS